MVTTTKEPKKEFTIRIVYFKPSGKFYTEAKATREFRMVGNSHNVCNMSDVTAWIRGLRDAGGQEALPGLSGSGWDGPILIDSDDGFPCLIMPRT